MQLKFYLPYITAVTSLKLDMSTKDKVLAAAVGMAAAYCVALPSSEVQSPASYYTSNAAMAAAQTVSEFNEATVLASTYAMEVAKKMWLYRYNVAHGRSVSVFEGPDALLSITGAKMIFSPEDLEFFQKHSEAIISVFNTCREVCSMVRENERSQVADSLQRQQDVSSAAVALAS